jgi:hypothetical protein
LNVELDVTVQRPHDADGRVLLAPNQSRKDFCRTKSAGGGLAQGKSMMRIVLILLLLCTPALAHDPGHPELDEWFNRLASGRGLCCSFTDGFAVSDVDWESKDGHYRVRLENNWIDVPDDALITEPNRAGRTMVWPLWFDGKILIRCFMPGSMG